MTSGVKAIASELGVTERTVWRYVRAGMPHQRCPRFGGLRVDIEAAKAWIWDPAAKPARIRENRRYRGRGGWRAMRARAARVEQMALPLAA